MVVWPGISRSPGDEGESVMRVIVAYDIGDDSRRLRVARALLAEGVRVQRSVFDCDLSARHLEELTARLSDLVDKRCDVVQIFPQCNPCVSARIDIGQAHSQMDESFWIV